MKGGDGKIRNVSFWGNPTLSCQPLNGQRLLLEDKVPCLNVVPCEGEVLVTLLGRRKALCMLCAHLGVGKEFLSMELVKNGSIGKVLGRPAMRTGSQWTAMTSPMFGVSGG